MRSSLLGRTALAAGVLALGLAAGQARAALIISGSVGGAPTGVNYVNFDDLPLGTAGGTSTNLPGSATMGGVSVAFSGGSPAAQAVQGSISGSWAAPFLSGGNGTAFSTPDGADATTYLTSEPGGSVTISFGGPQKYVGLLWGSVDAYNTLELWNGGTLVGSVTGSDVTASPNGDQGVNGTLYVNINSSIAFDHVILYSTAAAFEMDNLAYNTTSTVPEPVSMALLGAGLVGLGIARRRRG